MLASIAVCVENNPISGPLAQIGASPRSHSDVDPGCHAMYHIPLIGQRFIVHMLRACRRLRGPLFEKGAERTRENWPAT